MQKSKLQVFLLLFLIVGFTFGQPTITVQPQDQSITVGETATFSITATGEGTLSYQWHKAGSPLGGAISTSYTTPATTIDNDGDVYYCVVSDSNGSVESDNVTLSVSYPNSRVTDQLQALYDFDEGSGSVINDVSGVGAPLDLNIGISTAVNWTDNGLNVTGRAGIKSANLASKIYNACFASNELTMEAWILPTHQDQEWYSRILTVSDDNHQERNFGLIQKNGTLYSKCRTTWTGLDGGEESDNAYLRPMHFVFTRDASGTAKTYIDGILASTNTEDFQGNFSNWDSGYSLYLANDVANENLLFWEGTFYQLAIYSKALSDAEVTQNFNYGTNLDSYPIILEHPIDVTASVGNSATFSVTAIGENVSYQWQRNGSDISGANSSSYTIPSVSAGNNGDDYTCEVTSGSTTLTSNVGNLLVLLPGSRITDGAIAIYNFTEGSGSVINDVSGYSTALNLDISDLNDVEWSANGLEITSAANIFSSTAATKIHSRATARNEFAIELWIKPANTTQNGPSRILTFSQDGNARNFTLSQDGDMYEFRLRTDETDNNGRAKSTDSGSVSNELQHVVVVVSVNNVARLYINGVEQFNQDMGNNIYNWDSSYRLSLANEILDSYPWLGTVNYVAVFERILYAEEVMHNYEVGAYNVGELETPTNLTISEPTVGSVNLSWQDNSSYEDGFAIERSTLDTLHYVELGTVANNQSSYVDTTALEGTSYYYRVKGFNNFTGMNSDYSNQVNLISKLNVPTELALDASVLGQISVAWVDNSSNEDGYVLERGKGDPIAYVRLDSLSGTSYIDETVEEGVEYTYRVKTFNEVSESDYSETAMIRSKASFVSAPTNLVIELDGSSGAPVLTWTDNAFNETGYIVERKSITVGSEFTFIDSLEADEVTYTDGTVADSTAYVYRVYAFNDEYASDYSSEVFIQVVVGVQGFGEVPNEFNLAQNFPNPFNPSTTIRFGLPKSAEVSLKLYNLLGQELYTIVNGNYSAGTYSINFDASKLSSGIYVYSIVANSGDSEAFVQTKKMILLK